MLQRDKKGVSEIISYTILIVIALSMAAAVYSYLKIYVPKDKLECKEDITLIAQDINCSISSQELTLTISNKGLFRAEGAYVRLGNASQRIRSQINEDNIYFINPYTRATGINPGASYSGIYSFAEKGIIVGENILEIQPFVLEGSRIVICEKALLSQPINCG